MLDTAFMKPNSAVVCLVAAGLCACNTGPTMAVGDASITSASPVRGEQPVEPARADAGRVGEPPPPVTKGPDAGPPSWVPRDAPLTIVPAADRDRNLGIVPPVERTVTLDAGSVEVDIQIRPRP